MLIMGTARSARAEKASLLATNTKAPPTSSDIASSPPASMYNHFTLSFIV
jgi:hypothetical protein